MRNFVHSTPTYTYANNIVKTKKKDMRQAYRIINWYFKRNALPYWIILFLDCFILYFTALFIYWLNYRTSVTVAHIRPLSYIMLIYIFISMVFFRLFSTYSGIIRYSSFVDLQRVGYANLCALAVIIGLHYWVYRWPDEYFEHLTTLHLVTTYIIATTIMWGERVLVKILYDVVSNKEWAKPVFIYGIHDGGVALAKNIRSQRPVRFVLRGFLSPDKDHAPQRLMGVRVYKNREDLPAIIQNEGIECVLISPIRKREFRDDEELQDILISHGVKIYMVEEQLHETKDGTTLDLNREQMSLKEVNVEDLLPRDEIQVDLESVGRELTDKRILITGSAGSIGSEIVRQVASFKPAAMMLIDQAETPEHDIRLMMAKEFGNIPCDTVVTSICNQSRMEKIFSTFRPDYVFHAAAYKHVPMMEDNPSEAILNNVYGTRVMADLSVKYGTKKFVMVSTDKAVNPTNVMGCSKRICEIYVQSLDQYQKKDQNGKTATQFVTTRFGNVLGSNGSVIPLFREQIKQGGPVTVTDPNIIRYFMLIPEACKLVLEAGTKGNGGEIFVFDMGKPVKIADLAQRMIRLSGAKNVEVKFTGLRAGEKLYEEVLNDMESTKPSFHEKIRIASVREYDYADVCRDIEELIAIAGQYDDMATVKKMKEIVPEFKSNNSKYEVLDQKD